MINMVVLSLTWMEGSTIDKTLNEGEMLSSSFHYFVIFVNKHLTGTANVTQPFWFLYEGNTGI